MGQATNFFDRLLHAAASQPEPQRLLFVFADSEWGEDEKPAFRPTACVDKSPGELSGFDELATQPAAGTRGWGAVVIGALSGRDGRDPDGERVEFALRAMTDNVRSGRIAGYTVLDAKGSPLRFS